MGTTISTKELREPIRKIVSTQDLFGEKKEPISTQNLFGDKKQTVSSQELFQGVETPSPIDKGISQAVETTKAVLPKLPVMGFTPEQITKGAKFQQEVFRRPLAGLTALAVETPFADKEKGVLKTFKRGVLKPEEYPPHKMAEALVDAGMEPTSAGALATLGQFGYYLGVGKVLSGVIQKGKVSLLNKAIKNVSETTAEARGIKGVEVKLKPDVAKAIAQNKDIASIVDAYTKSKNLKLTPQQTIRSLEAPEGILPKPMVPLAPKLAPTKDLGRLSILRKGDVKKIVRETTGQYTPIVPTIKEPQALREVLKREEQVARVSARITKKETKETLGLIRGIKKMPIEGMAFEEKAQIEGLKTQVKQAKTLNQLRGLYDEIQKVKELGKQKYIQTTEAKKEQFALGKEVLLKTINTSVKPITPKGLSVDRVSKLGELPKVARATTLRPVRIFDAFDGGQNFEGPHNKFYYQRANLAENNKLQEIDKRRTNIVSQMKAIGITENELTKSREISGVKFTVDEMLSLYTGAKNREKTLALVYGNKIPFGLMRNVIAQMTPQEKALGDAIIEDYENNYQRLRKEFIEYTDGKTDLGKVSGGYTPIKRTMSGYIPTENELANELLERQGLKKAYAERGFTKERVLKIPKQYQHPIRLGELGIWTEQMAKQEHFIAYGNIVKELQRMANDPQFSEAIKSKFGGPYLETTRNWVNRVANPNIYKAYGQLEKMAATFRQNSAIAYLGLNIITMLKQAPSLALFLSDVNYGELISGIYDLTTGYKNRIELIHKLSPQMKHRSLERELEEFKNRDPNKYRQFIKRFGEKAMFGIYEIDKLVTHSGWLAVYNKYTRQGLSPEESADIATRAVLRTQPAAHAKDIAELYGTNAFLNLFTQFTNQLNQIYNIITYDIPAKAKARDYRGAIRAGFGVALSAYLIAWMARGRPPLTPKELAETGIEQGTNYIPMVGRGFTSKEKGFDFISIPALSGFGAIGEAVTALKKGQPKKALIKIIKAGAVLGGIPFAQPRRVLTGLGDIMSGETKDARRLLYSEYTLRGKKKKRGLGGLSGLSGLKPLR